MAEYYKDNPMVKLVESLSDELSGFEDYTTCAKNAQDPELKKMYEDMAMDEKRHAQTILAHINKMATTMLK